MDHRDMIRMANQIATFFNGEDAELSVKDTAEHINKFWDPRMRAQLIAHIEKGGEGLNETILKAAKSLKRPQQMAA